MLSQVNAMIFEVICYGTAPEVLHVGRHESVIGFLRYLASIARLQDVPLL